MSNSTKKFKLWSTRPELDPGRLKTVRFDMIHVIEVYAAFLVLSDLRRVGESTVSSEEKFVQPNLPKYQLGRQVQECKPGSSFGELAR